MTNDFLPEIFSAYLDDEATIAERADVERRLNASPTERESLEELEQISADLRSLPQKELPESFAARVMAAAERDMLIPIPSSGNGETVAHKKEHRPWLRWAIPLASSAAALLLCWKLLGPFDPQADPETHVNTNTPQPAGSFLSSHTGPENRSLVFRKEIEVRKPAEARKPDPATRELANADAAYIEPLIPPVNMATDGIADSDLIFVDDLRKITPADIGRVVTAVEKTESGVAVVRLTVVDCGDNGLNDLQLLLSRNAIRRHPGEAPLADRIERQVVVDDAAKGKLKNAKLVAVYVRSTSDRLKNALAELQSELKFRSLEAGRTIAAEEVDDTTWQQMAMVDEQRDAYGLPKNMIPGLTNRTRMAKSVVQSSQPAPGGGKNGKQVGNLGGKSRGQEGLGGIPGPKKSVAATGKSQNSPDTMNDFNEKKSAELVRISEQLKLAVPADLLKNAQNSYRRLNTFASDKSNSSMPGKSAVTTPTPVRVLFVVVCSPEAGAQSPAAKPAK